MNNSADTIEVSSLHSEKMQDEELIQMIKADTQNFPIITVGNLVQLYLVRSPLVIGGNIQEKDIKELKRLIQRFNFADHFSVDSIVNAITTGMRGLEIIEVGKKNDTTKFLGHSEHRIYSPEWLADTFSAVATVYPAVTWDAFLWKLPLAVVTHLVAAAHRFNGGKTARPVDWNGLLDKSLKSNSENASYESEENSTVN